ncbi:MAG: TIGR00645 family protein, partial [Alphaproteobacteria bacterium]|nr:TIGR00645 family protein [Alphaproteobacteria bacterium]
MERLIEKTLFYSRWLLASLYLGLVLAMVFLTITFAREVIHIVP